MQPTERDPRVDPKAGDVLRKAGVEREVVQVFPHRKELDIPTRLGDLDYMQVGRRDPRRIYLYNWRRWAKDAEVIHASD